MVPGELSGVDLAYEVARRFPTAGIIVASGQLTPSDITLPPAAEFYSKPYDFATIVTRLGAMSKR